MKLAQSSERFELRLSCPASWVERRGCRCCSSSKPFVEDCRSCLTLIDLASLSPRFPLASTAHISCASSSWLCCDYAAVVGPSGGLAAVLRRVGIGNISPFFIDPSKEE